MGNAQDLCACGVCVCVCVCVRARVCMRACVRVRVHVYAHARVRCMSRLLHKPRCTVKRKLVSCTGSGRSFPPAVEVEPKQKSQAGPARRPSRRPGPHLLVLCRHLLVKVHLHVDVLPCGGRHVGVAHLSGCQRAPGALSLAASRACSRYCKARNTCACTAGAGHRAAALSHPGQPGNQPNGHGGPRRLRATGVLPRALARTPEAARQRDAVAVGCVLQLKPIRGPRQHLLGRPVALLLHLARGLTRTVVTSSSAPTAGRHNLPHGVHSGPEGRHMAHLELVLENADQAVRNAALLASARAAWQQAPTPLLLPHHGRCSGARARPGGAVPRSRDGLSIGEKSCGTHGEAR